MPVTVQGPDGKMYQLPDGTDRDAAIGYFKKKGIGAAPPEAPAAPMTKPGTFDYHPPGTEPGAAQGSFADTVLRPIGNVGRAIARTPGDLFTSAKQAITALPSQAASFAHPLDTMRKSAGIQLVPDNDPALQGTTVKQSGEKIAAPQVDYDRELPNAIGSAVGQTILAEGLGKVVGAAATPGGLKAKVAALGDSLIEKPVPSGTVKEKLRQTGRATLGADDFTIRKAVKDAADKITKSDEAVADSNATVLDQRSRRRQAENELDAATQNLRDKQSSMKVAAGAQNAQNWNTLRSKMTGVTPDMRDVLQTIKGQEATMDPMTVAQFRSMLRTGADEDAIAGAREDAMRSLGFGDRPPLTLPDGTIQEQPGTPYEDLNPQQKAMVDDATQASAGADGIDPESTQPPPFTRLHGWYTELGQKMYGGGGQIPGNIYTGLKNVRDAVGRTMETTAAQNGALEDLRAARKSHQQYAEAFKGARNKRMSTADIDEQKTNPEAFAQKLEDERRQKLATIDPEYTAHAEAVDKLRDRLKTFPTEQQMVQQVKPPEDAPTVDPQKIAKDAIEAKAASWKTLTKRDLGMIGSSILAGPLVRAIGGDAHLGLYAMGSVAGFEAFTRGLALYAQKPGVAEWFAKSPAGEIEALQRIPGADRVKIANTYAQVADEAARQGRLKTLDPKVAAFLGATNAQTIQNAIDAKQAQDQRKTLPQTAGEAKQRVSDAVSRPTPTTP